MYNNLTTFELENIFKRLLSQIVQNDTNYNIREQLIYEAIAIAKILGFESGVRVDDPKWPVFVIKLPDGEVAWHCRSTELRYDGHTTEEKFKRIKQYVKNWFTF